jgi:hypothetical protein
VNEQPVAEVEPINRRAISATNSAGDREKEHLMETTWRVVKVTATEGRTIAELVRVEWFKKNPALDPDKVYGPDEAPEEFIDAHPVDKGAEFIEAEGTLTLDISGEDDPEMWPGADVFLNVTVVDPVDA